MVSLLFGEGDGTFQPQVNYQEGFLISGLAVGDFNADGLTDLAIASGQNGTVFILAGDGHGHFRTQGTYGAGQGPVSLAVADFEAKTGFGGPDLAVANFYSNTISVFHNTLSTDKTRR